jgi:hypothetical protein
VTTSSLLQDFLGKSLFDDVTHPTLSTEASAFNLREGKQGVTSFFQAAAYLMPPLEAVFESIMLTFLTPRSTTGDAEGHG